MKIQISVSINKVLLEHRHTHLLIYYPWLLLHYTAAELNSCNRNHITGKAKIFSVWAIREKVCQPLL